MTFKAGQEVPRCEVALPYASILEGVIDNHRFYKYDTEEAEDIAQELGVNMMPSFHIFKDGEPVQSVTGAKSKQLEEAIKGVYDGKVVDE